LFNMRALLSTEPHLWARKRAVPQGPPTVEVQDFAAYASFCGREPDLSRQCSIDRSRHRHAKAARLLPVPRVRGLWLHQDLAREQCRRKEKRRDRPRLASLCTGQSTSQFQEFLTGEHNTRRNLARHRSRFRGDTPLAQGLECFRHALWANQQARNWRAPRLPESEKDATRH